MAIQNWGAVPSSINFSHIIGEPAPSSQNVVTNFRDIVPPEVDSYDFIYLEYSVNVAWLFVSGINIPYSITTTTISETLTYGVVIDGLPSGIYQAIVSFRIMGVNPGNPPMILSSWNYDVYLKVLGGLIPIPDILEPWLIEYYQGTAIPAPNTIDMDGTDWVLRSPPEFVLTADSEVIITQGQDGWATATATGPYTVTVTLANSWLTEELGGYDFFIYLNPDTQIAQTQPVRVLVLEVVEWAFSPENLHFDAIKNYQEAEAQLLIIDSVSEFNVVAFPAWLTVDPIIGQNHVTLTVVPVETINTDAGEYEGTIDIERIVDTVTVTESIPVTYTLIGFISTPYVPGNFAFTLDTNYLRFFSDYIDTYFRVKLTAIVHEFYTGVAHTKEFFYKVPLFQQQQKMNIGRVVDRLMFRLQEYNDTEFAQYTVADVSLYITEIQRATDTMVREFYLNNIKFAAGLTPQTLINNMAFLNVNPAPSRVTTKSFYFLNYLIPTGTFTLLTLRNGTQVASEVISSGTNNIFTKKIVFDTFTIGDTITLKLKNTADEVVEKKFYVFEQGKESNHLIWEDEYKLKQALEFTGSYQINQGIVNVMSNYYRDLLAVLEKIDSTKSADLTINTGWLSQSDQVSITSLLSQKKAWLHFTDGAVLDLVPISQKIRSVDSDRALISFDIQFKINFKDNAQTYSF